MSSSSLCYYSSLSYDDTMHQVCKFEEDLQHLFCHDSPGQSVQNNTLWPGLTSPTRSKEGSIVQLLRVRLRKAVLLKACCMRNTRCVLPARTSWAMRCWWTCS